MDTLGEAWKLRLLGRAEVLLFVDDDEAEVGELHVLCRKRLRADHDFQHAAPQPLLGLSRLRAWTGSWQASHLDAERAEPLAEGFDMLPRQHGRRRRDRHLLAGQRHCGRRPQRDLGLAEADVTADHPVHGVARRKIV
jgi:hypothetical protein